MARFWLVRTCFVAIAFFAGGASAQEVEIGCPGAGTDLVLSSGSWIILGDCQLGGIELTGSARLRFQPTPPDPASLVNANVTIAGRVTLSNSSAIVFAHMDIVFPQTFINEFELDARDASRVRVANSTILTMDENGSFRSMFWKIRDDAAIAVTGSSRMDESWLILSLFDRAVAHYGDSFDFFTEVYFTGDTPTTFVASGGSVEKLWLPLTQAGDYLLVPDSDMNLHRPYTVVMSGVSYDVGVILQSLQGVAAPSIRIKSGSHITMNIGVGGAMAGPVTLDGLQPRERLADEFLPAPFDQVLLEAGAFIDWIQVYIISSQYPVTVSNSIINEIGVIDTPLANFDPDPCDPCSEAIVENSIIGWGDSAAVGSRSDRTARLTLVDTDIWNSIIFASEFGRIDITGNSAILGGSFVESTGSVGCTGTCSELTIESTVTITPNPPCIDSLIAPDGTPLCQPLREPGVLPMYFICNGGELRNDAIESPDIVSCASPPP